MDLAPPDAAASLSFVPQRCGSRRLRHRDKAPERVAARVAPRDQRLRIKGAPAEIRLCQIRLVTYLVQLARRIQAASAIGGGAVKMSFGVA